MYIDLAQKTYMYIIYKVEIIILVVKHTKSLDAIFLKKKKKKNVSNLKLFFQYRTRSIKYDDRDFTRIIIYR